MKISVVQNLPYPQLVVFRSLRDHLPALAAYMPNLSSIVNNERHEIGAGEVKLVNVWKAAPTEVPTLARPFLDPSKLSWIDRSHWRTAEWSNTWEMEVSFLKERVTCKGRTTYLAKSESPTEARIDGVLELDLKGMVPGLLARKVEPMIEGFVIGLIKPNFEKINDGLVLYLKAHPELTT